MLHSLFHEPRRYPRVYEDYYDTFNFYDGREKWLESIEGIPAEAVHLFSLHWLHLEVYNGGFWQYFYNSTGITFPEAVAGFEAIEMPKVSEVIRSAAAKLGAQFPFDMDERRRLVGDSNKRMAFESLDEEFYELADTNQFFRRLPKFVPLADSYANRFESRMKV